MYIRLSYACLTLPTLNMALWLAKFSIYVTTSMTGLIGNARTLYRLFQNGIFLDVARQRESPDKSSASTASACD